MCLNKMKPVCTATADWNTPPEALSMRFFSGFWERFPRRISIGALVKILHSCSKDVSSIHGSPRSLTLAPNPSLPPPISLSFPLPSPSRPLPLAISLSLPSSPYLPLLSSLSPFPSPPPRSLSLSTSLPSSPLSLHLPPSVVLSKFVASAAIHLITFWGKIKMSRALPLTCHHSY